MIDPIDIASVIVSLIAASAAIASQRAAARASVVNTKETSRVDMEKEAYERARAYDTETIRRQDAEIEEIRASNIQLNDDLKILHADNKQLHTDNELLRLDNEKLLVDNKHLRGQVEALRAEVAKLRFNIPPALEITDGK